MPSSVIWLVVCLVGLMPGVLAWHWGRDVARHADDPLFAERFWAYRKRVGIAAGVGGALVPMTMGFAQDSMAVGAIGISVLVVGLLVAIFHTHKQVFRETWSFWTFATFYLRLFLAFGGFWLLLLLGPEIVQAAGRGAAAASVALILVLGLWSRHSPQVTASLLGARPIADPELESGLTQLLAQTTLPRPALFQAGPAGGVLANAFAIPSPRRSAVLFFSTLLERLTRDEVIAILAHELAHLEQFDGPVLGRHRLVTNALIVSSAVVVPLIGTWLGNGGVLFVIWACLVFAGVSYLGRGRKGRETEGDARAAELVGDPETLISALTRLYAIAHVPRRWDAATEARASHPALARRIQALRRDAAVNAPAVSSAPVVIRVSAAGGYLIFEQDRLRHLQNVPDLGSDADVAVMIQHAERAEAFLFERITAVHLDPRAPGAELVIETGANNRTRIAVAAERIPELQAALERLDVRLGSPESAAGHIRTIRIATIFLAALSYLIAGPVLLVQAVLAIVWASPRSGAAVAAAGAATALMAATAGTASGVLVVGLVILSAMIARSAIQSRRTGAAAGPRARWELGVLVLWTLLTAASLGLAGFSAIRMSQVAAERTAAIVAPVSLAAWLWLAPGRQSRRAQTGVLAAALVAIAVALTSTTWFVDAFSHDPLLVTASHGVSPRFTRRPVQLAEAFGPFPIDHPGELRLGPHGSTFATVQWCDTFDSATACRFRRVSVGDDSGVHRSFDATDVRFVDDAELIVLKAGETSAVVSVESTTGMAGWAVTIPSADVETLLVDPASRRWVVMGHNGGTHRVFTGTIGEVQVASRDWAMPEDDHHWIEWLIDDGVVALGVKTEYDNDGDTMLSRLRRLALPDSVNILEVSSLVNLSGDPFAISELELSCYDAPPGRPGIMCFASDRHRTHVWQVDARHQLQPVGWLDARTFASWPPSGERWVVSGIGRRCSWQVLDVAKREAAALSFPRTPCPSTVVMAGSRLATLTRNASDATELRVYDIR